MKNRSKKVETYKIGRLVIPDYVPGILAGLVILFGFPFLGESQPSAEITTEEVAEQRFVLFGRGGNIMASIGDQGVLIVDSQFPDMVPKYRAAIRSLGGGEIDFTINTHWHFDHADGNELLGDGGTWIVAHSHSRDMMMKDNTNNRWQTPPLNKAPTNQEA